MKAQQCSEQLAAIPIIWNEALVGAVTGYTGKPLQAFMAFCRTQKTDFENWLHNKTPWAVWVFVKEAQIAWEKDYIV